MREGETVACFIGVRCDGCFKSCSAAAVVAPVVSCPRIGGPSGGVELLLLLLLVGEFVAAVEVAGTACDEVSVLLVVLVVATISAFIAPSMEDVGIGDAGGPNKGGVNGASPVG